MDLNVQMTDRELGLLKNIIGKNKIIVEIGCYMGKVTCGLAEANIVIGIDPFIGEYDSKDGASNNMDGVEDFFKTKIKNKNIIWYKKKGEEVLDFWKMPIDGVIIDGEHTEWALTKDLEWIDWVKTDGILAFHDYLFFDEVTRIIDRKVRPFYQEIGRERYLIIFRK